MVVLPEDSGPKISTTRPRGTPPTPSAASNEIQPVQKAAIGTTASFEPRRITEPLPNCFSSCESAVSIALLRSSATINVSSRYRQRILASKNEKAKKKRIATVSADLAARLHLRPGSTPPAQDAASLPLRTSGERRGGS